MKPSLSVFMSAHALGMRVQPIFMLAHVPFMYTSMFISSYKHRIQHAYACRDPTHAYASQHAHAGI